MNLKTILIPHVILTHYREPFFSALKQQLAANNYTLLLSYGPPPADYTRDDTADIEWAQKIKNSYLPIPFTAKHLLWQHYFHLLKNCDLIILTQEVKLLMNYVVLLLRLVNPRLKVAFWGHGVNFQSDRPASMAERVKGFISTRVDWWFAYNNRSAQAVAKLGFPREKITAVMNSIDTRSMMQHYDALSPQAFQAARASIDNPQGPCAIYCGGMYAEKRIAFLIEAAQNIRNKVDGFTLILIGSGSDSALATQAAQEHRWIHYLKPAFGEQKLALFAISEIMLMPGLVGLGILDSFATQTPLFTTDYPFHSPEIEYLETGVNGMMTENTLDSYCTTIVDYLTNPHKLDTLKDGCKQSIQKYSVEAMAQNFVNGIKSIL
jgi:glycosyltransferase involved in cell wall biosynthesis